MRGPQQPDPEETYKYEFLFLYNPKLYLNLILTNKLKGKIWPLCVCPASMRSVLSKIFSQIDDL